MMEGAEADEWKDVFAFSSDLSRLLTFQNMKFFRVSESSSPALIYHLTMCATKLEILVSSESILAAKT